MIREREIVLLRVQQESEATVLISDELRIMGLVGRDLENGVVVKVLVVDPLVAGD